MQRFNLTALMTTLRYPRQSQPSDPATDIPLVLVGHTSKAQGSRGYNSSVVGAGAWENDTQQTAYFMGGRYTITTLGKTRFDKTVTDYEIKPETVTIKTENKLGFQQVPTKITFGIVIPFSKEKTKTAEDARKKRKPKPKPRDSKMTC